MFGKTKTLDCLVSSSIIAGIFLAPFVSLAEMNESTVLKSLYLQVAAISHEIERLQVLVQEQLATTTPILSDDDIRSVIHDGVQWMIHTQESNGHFRYEYVPYEDRYLDDDHIVRQSGALYILGEVLRKDATDQTPELREVIERALDFFEARTINGTFDSYSFRCVTNRPGDTKCILGTTSLVLVGLLDYVERYPEMAPRYASQIGGYVSYIMAMKKGGAGFRNYYHANKATQSEFESSYSNGEALLALVRYYEQHPSSEVRAVIDDTFTYLDSNRDSFDAPLYLWAMAALKELQRISPDTRYGDYALEYTDWRIERFKKYRGSQKNLCAYIEGVVSAYSIFEDTLTDREKSLYREEIDYWLYQSEKLQVGNDDAYRLIYADTTVSIGVLANVHQATGGFLTSQEILTQRIDFTQHCLSSYIQTFVDIEGKQI